MLTVHRAEQSGALVDGLAALLRVPLPDVLAADVVAVPARGVERWLTQQLGQVLGESAPGAADGVCAGIAFPSVGSLVDEALAAADGTGVEDPWARPVWPLLDVVDAALPEPWCAVLARHLGEGRPGHRRGRRYAVVAHLAELYSSYAAARPAMLRDWAAGRDTDGELPLPPDLTWQAELWRRLRARLGPSPGERLQERCAALRAEPGRSALPERLSLFGPTRLTTAQLAVVDALAAGRDVHLWLPHPGPGLWEALRDAGGSAGTARGGTARGGTTRRRDDTTATLPRAPLLRSQARDVRELQLRLPAHHDVHHPGPPDPPATLLGRLQADLRDDLPPSAVPADLPADGSLRVHACHGPARQVEVLREVLLRLFQDDPALQPRDVVVMCPDVDTFAPLVSAAFGLGPELPHPGHALRVRLADRSPRRTNPLLAVVGAVLELAGGRVTASQVLDLAAAAPVRRRFFPGDDDLDRVRDWVARAGVRWALDARGRAPYGLDAVPQNTWRAGLDRLLLGVTTAEDEPVWLGLALPLDDVDSSDIALAGRLAELLDVLDLVLDRLRGERPAQEWTAALADALELLTAVPAADAWQLAQARSALAEAGRDGAAPVGLPDVRALLADRLRGRPTRSGFRTGHLTVCTMVPMRSVPHRVVVLLGLDDGVFPRTAGLDGDDVLARDPELGERDVRSEDRQLFLDAVLAARERLVVLFTGADPVTGAARPPAVPVGELLDVVEAMAPGGREAVVVRHPLQPYDARDHRGPQPFSFDRVALAGARAAEAPRTAPAPPLPLPRRGGPVALDDLVAFLEHPVRAHLRQRLQVTLPGEDDEVDDALPVALDPLQEWAVGQRLLEAALRGLDPADTRRREWLRGTLPPGPLGSRVLDRVQDRLEPLVAAGAPLLALPARVVDVRLTVAGRVLTGTLPAVRDGAAVAVGWSSLAARHRVRAWVLALVLGAAGEGDRGVAVGRWGRRARTSTVRAPADPLALLAELVDLHDRGLCEPLPLATRTSAAYAAARSSGVTAEQALESARREWSGGIAGERDDRSHRYVWGAVPLDHLLQAAARPGEEQAGETTRFGALARRLWEPLLQAEELT